MSIYISQFILLGILLVLSAFFSGSETAIFSLSRIEKKRLEHKHPATWHTIKSLLSQPRRTLITILIGNTIVNTAAITVVTLMAVEAFGPQGVGLTIGLFTLILLMTSELLPKVFAVRHNELIAFFCSIPLDIVARTIYPVRQMIRFVADWVLSYLVPEKSKNPDLLSEDQLKALVQIGEEEGVLGTGERDMIHKLIGLGDRMVREIMIPRTEMVAFDIDEGSDKLTDLIQESHFSYFPIYQKSIDNLVGVISTQKFMLDINKNLKKLMEPINYIPETKQIDEFLLDFQRVRCHVSICVDEYGGTAGMITMEDVIEEIFGEFYDEYAKAEPLIRPYGRLRYVVQAKMGLHELEEQLGIQLESQASETLNGWLLEQFGRIPKANETLSRHDVEYKILEVHKHRIARVEIYHPHGKEPGAV
jgi:putative hemolysin